MYVLYYFTLRWFTSYVTGRETSHFYLETSFNFSCFSIFLFKNVRIVGAILFLFVWCFLFVTLAFVITMASANQYDSLRHGNAAQTCNIESLTFILTDVNSTCPALWRKIYSRWRNNLCIALTLWWRNNLCIALTSWKRYCVMVLCEMTRHKHRIYVFEMYVIKIFTVND